jgi:hypothetical protein
MAATLRALVGEHIGRTLDLAACRRPIYAWVWMLAWVWAGAGAVVATTSTSATTLAAHARAIEWGDM